MKSAEPGESHGSGPTRQEPGPEAEEHNHCQVTGGWGVGAWGCQYLSSRSSRFQLAPHIGWTPLQARWQGCLGKLSVKGQLPEAQGVETRSGEAKLISIPPPISKQFPFS